MNDSSIRLLKTMPEKTKLIKRDFWIIGVPNLFLTVISSASILPLTINIKIEDSYLKLLWRNITMLPFLVIMSYFEVYYKKQQGSKA